MRKFFVLSLNFLLFLSFSRVSADYYSQCNQDRFVNENFFNNKRNGTFVDIGAYDGITISNTYFFEKELGWRGICIEPLPNAYVQLKNNRSAICINCAVGPNNGMTNFFDIDAKKFPELAMLSGELKYFTDAHIANLKEVVAKYEGRIEIVSMAVRNINDILLEYGFFNIDFLSLDVEGAELDILNTLDFNTFKIRIMTVENNAREANPQIRQFLESKGFRFVLRLEQDEVYENILL